MNTTNNNTSSYLNKFAREIIDERNEKRRVYSSYCKKNSTLLIAVLNAIEKAYTNSKRDAKKDKITICFQNLLTKLNDKPIVNTPVPVYGIRGTTYTSKELELVMLYKGLYKTFTKTRCVLSWKDNQKKDDEKEDLSLVQILNRVWMTFRVDIKESKEGEKGYNTIITKDVDELVDMIIDDLEF